MGDAQPQEGYVVGKVRETYLSKGLRGLFPSFPTKKMAVSNLVILVVFLIAFCTEGGLWGDRWVICHPRRVTW